MLFFDYEVETNFKELNIQLGGHFSDRIVNSLKEIQAKMNTDFNKKEDIYELVLADIKA